jgi:HemY protein
VRLLFASLVALLAAIGAGILFSRDTGRVLVSFGEWTVQMTLSFFIVAIVLLFVVVYVLIRSLLQLIHLPQDWGRWSLQRRRRRSERFLLDGLVAMLGDDWPAAERAFRRGAPFSRAPALNLLGAARSALRQGALKRRDQYLKLAHQESGGDSAEAELIRARLQLDGAGTEQGYSTLKGLEARHPQDERVRLALLDAAVRLEDWDEAQRLIEHVPGKLLPGGELTRRQIAIHGGLLRKAGHERLPEQWQRIPAKLQREPRLLAAYVTARLRHADAGDCEAPLRRAIERFWDAELVRLYGQVQAPDPARQLRTAESWLEHHPGDGDLLLTLGRLCRRAELWGKAREYLERCIRAGAQPDAFLELGALHVQQGDLAAAADCFRKGLERAARPASA